MRSAIIVSTKYTYKTVIPNDNRTIINTVKVPSNNKSYKIHNSDGMKRETAEKIAPNVDERGRRRINWDQGLVVHRDTILVTAFTAN